MKLAILGSCVTRDAVELAQPLPQAGAISLVDYTARTSLASLAASPLPLDALSDQISSSFQRRMVRQDMRKTFWQRLEQLSFDTLVVDFVDDRFPLHLFENGAAHTVSAEYRRVYKTVSLPPFRVLTPDHPERMALWERGFQRLCDSLKQRGLLDRLVINAVFWAPGGDPQKTDQANARLARLYQKAAAHVPPSAFLRYPPGLLQMDPDHQWGSAPFHYQLAAYQHFMRQMRDRFSPPPLSVAV